MSFPVRFAVIGCGSIAPTHARALKALPGAEFVACCDILPERAQAFAHEFGGRAMAWPAILADPEIDVVSLCVPSGIHAELGVPALLAGKHVVVEKPLEISLASCDKLISAQAQSGRQLTVISQHRFDSASRTVRDVLDTGALGPLFFVDVRVPWFRTQAYYSSEDWRGTWAYDGGGCLMNQGVHTVDLMRWLCGPVESVYARSCTAAHPDIETEDILAATLTFASGAIGTLMASTAIYPGFPARLALHGGSGSAIIEGDALLMLAIQGQEFSGGETSVAHAVQVATGGTRAATAALHAAADPTGLWGDSHRAQLADFVHACQTGEPPKIGAAEGRAAVAIILACYESARSGQVVRLDQAAQ